MQQTVQDTVNLIIDSAMEEIIAGDADAGVLIENVDEFVKSVWGSKTPQFNLIINEMILSKLEQIRVSRENDQTFHKLFIQNNIEAILQLEVPARLEKVLEAWIEIGEHVAPTAARIAQRKYKRPDRLSELLNADVLSKIQVAVEEGDSEKLESALELCEESLESNLRLRLSAKPEFTEPISEIRNKSEIDRFFDQARRLLREQNSKALEKFREIHFHRPGHTVAKEWYAYALTLFGHSTDIHEIIELLQDAISSEYFRLEFGWTARWNLACAIRKLPKRANEALDILLPVLDLDFHTPDSFELCLLWAFEQDRREVLSPILLKSPFHEAHLLAALYDVRNPSQNNQTTIHNHFLRIGRILRDIDHVFPDPAERLGESELDRLTQEFIQNSLIDAGIEWFRQRLSIGREKNYYKNWECAARLNEIAEDMDSAWRCRERQWSCTATNHNINPEQKGKLLRGLLTWAEKNGYQESGLRILRTNWKKTSFKNEDIQYWEKRLQKTPFNNSKINSQTQVKNSVLDKSDKPTEEQSQTDERAPRIQISTNEDAENIIQRTAGSFKSVSNVDTLSTHAADADDLLSAVKYKHSDLSQDAILAIKEIIRFSIIFHQGVDEATGQTIALAIRNNIEVLREKKVSCPFELMGLIEACERVAQHISVRIKSIPDLSITPPSDLKLIFGKPDVGETYSTRICARLTNPSSETIEKITVAFTSPSEFIRVPSEEIFVPSLLASDKCLAECSVDIEHGVEDSVEIRVYVAYEIRGIRRSVQNSCKVAVEEIETLIPVTERYVTSRPVDVDRVDLFHGRSRELKDLMAAFSGERMRKLYFVNGIRRVGKSSLMQHLGNKYKENAVSVLLNVETVLGGEEMSPIQFVRQLIKECLRQIKENPLYKNLPLTPPTMEKFEIDTPWAVFDDFLEDVRRFADKKNVLLCFDEIQRLVEKIADEKDPMNEGFLSWLRGKVQSSVGALIVCTGSEPYSIMRQRYNHTLWANMEPYNVSFVNKDAAKKIAVTPVEIDEVIWLPEALERLWDMTEGHPWMIQILAEKSCERINQEKRRLIMPSDIENAADITAMDDNASKMWWNESNGLLTSEHRRVAFLIIQNQTKSRQGLSETNLAEICHRAGLRNIGNLLEEMKALEVISGEKEHNEMQWRIKGAYLEKHIVVLEQREHLENPAAVVIGNDLPLALMLDWENIKIELSKHIAKLAPEKEAALRERLDVKNLAKRLYDAASIHGVPRQKWAVANWDNSFFQGDQADLRKNIRFETDMAGDSKADASDHVLRERIHEVLREHREISTYIIATGDADFLEAIRTLQKEGKRVILWSLRNSINPSYKYLMSGSEAITLEWLEDIVFEG